MFGPILCPNTGVGHNSADPDLVNGWAWVDVSLTSPYWVSDNGTGKSTL